MSTIDLYKHDNQGPSGAIYQTGVVDGTKNRTHVEAKIDPDQLPLETTNSNVVSENLVIYNKTVPSPASEVSQILSASTKKALVRCRDNARIQLAFVSGDSGTNYITIPSGASLTLEDVVLTGKTLYFQTNVGGKIVEILEWS